MAVEHLLAQRRQRIAFVALNDESVAAQERLRGYHEALRDFGLRDAPDLVVRAGHTIEHGFATEQLLAMPAGARPDAILYASDTMALAGLRRLLDAGVRVPEDVAVAGYGDIPFAALSEPPLTTVRVHKEQIGTLTAQMLEQIIADTARQPGDIEVGVELVIRGSTAGPSPR